MVKQISENAWKWFTLLYGVAIGMLVALVVVCVVGAITNTPSAARKEYAEFMKAEEQRKTELKETEANETLVVALHAQIWPSSADQPEGIALPVCNGGLLLIKRHWSGNGYRWVHKADGPSPCYPYRPYNMGDGIYARFDDCDAPITLSNTTTITWKCTTQPRYPSSTVLRLVFPDAETAESMAKILQSAKKINNCSKDQWPELNEEIDREASRIPLHKIEDDERVIASATGTLKTSLPLNLTGNCGLGTLKFVRSDIGTSFAWQFIPTDLGCLQQPDAFIWAPMQVCKALEPTENPKEASWSCNFPRSATDTGPSLNFTFAFPDVPSAKRFHQLFTEKIGEPIDFSKGK